jgi:hypothetical protein
MYQRWYIEDCISSITISYYLLISLHYIYSLPNDCVLKLNLNLLFRTYVLPTEEVFSDTQHLVHSILDGYNVCIFAYGQSDRMKKDIHYGIRNSDNLVDSSLFLTSENYDDFIYASM